jgi:hypothetical protein
LLIQESFMMSWGRLNHAAIEETAAAAWIELCKIVRIFGGCDKNYR